MARPSRARVVYEPPARVIEPFRGPNSFSAFPIEFLRAKNHTDNLERLESVLAGCQSLERLEPHDKPTWNPPEIEDKTTDLDVARMLLRDALGNGEPFDWDEARVWREMYEHTYEIADKLRQMAQDLDDKLDEEIKHVDEHNNEIDGLADQARRLQLDLGL